MTGLARCAAVIPEPVEVGSTPFVTVRWQTQTSHLVSRRDPADIFRTGRSRAMHSIRLEALLRALNVVHWQR